MINILQLEETSSENVSSFSYHFKVGLKATDRIWKMEGDGTISKVLKLDGNKIF